VSNDRPLRTVNGEGGGVIFQVFAWKVVLWRTLSSSCLIRIRSPYIRNVNEPLGGPTEGAGGTDTVM